jgi:hypothetical protein
VIGVLALVGLVVGLVLLLTGDDDKDGDKGDDETTAATDGDTPEQVVEKLVAAAAENDCDAAEKLLTDTAKDSDPCSQPEFQLLSGEDVESEVGEAEVDGEEAEVPVEFTTQDGSSDYVFRLEQVDGQWLVESYDVDHDSGRVPVDPTDVPTEDDPTDPPSSGSPSAGGSSTADAVANNPEAVVEAFLDSVVSGDCATAEDLVTEAYITEEGNCDSSDIPSDFDDQIEYTVGKATVDDAAGTATVPVEVNFAGDKESSSVKLVKVGGNWRVNEFE